MGDYPPANFPPVQDFESAESMALYESSASMLRFQQFGVRLLLL